MPEERPALFPLPLPGVGGSGSGAGGAASAGGTSSSGGTSADVGCEGISPPSGTKLSWLHAADLQKAEGATVDQWPSRDQGASFGSGSASYGSGSQGTSAVVRFSGGQKLYSRIAISGLDDLTVALVSRTTVHSLAPGDWCQSFNMAISENGCSGTFNTPVMWDEAGDWGFTYVGAVQDQVSFRFGTGNKTYSNLDDPAIQALRYDPNVAWLRPESKGDRLTSTVLQKDGGTMRLFVDGALVLEQGLPGGPGTLKNMHDTVWLGGGRGDFHWGGEIAELIVYGGALSDSETATLNRYLLCEHPEIE